MLILSYMRQFPRISIFIAGLIVPLAYPPFNIVPLFYLSFGVAFYLAYEAKDAKDARLSRLALLGWLFAFGQFVVGLHWIGASFLVSGGLYVYAMPFAIFFLLAGLALYGAAAFVLWGVLWQAGRVWHLDKIRAPILVKFAAMLLLAVCWAVFEYARGTFFSGFPWLVSGMAWAGFSPLAQSASLVGLYGMGLLALIGVALFATPHKASYAASFVLLMGMSAFGISRLNGDVATSLTSPISLPNSPPAVLVVQPNIAQHEKWLASKRAAHIAKTFALMQAAFAAHPEVDVLILPETALPVLIDEDDGFARRLAALLPPDKWIILGATRRDKNTALNNFGHNYSKPNYYNSVMVWHIASPTSASTGADTPNVAQLVARADKHHLVPFGEYLPWQKGLEAIGLRQLTQLRGGFTAAAAPADLDLRQIGLGHVRALICYEAIFPHLAATHKAAWLLNLTNDAWFGTTFGPAQHLAHARLRAIEQGIPLVRSANTGISAAFDGRGRLLAHLPLNQAGFFAVSLPDMEHLGGKSPEKSAEKPTEKSTEQKKQTFLRAFTFYSLYGNYIFLALVLGALSAVFVAGVIATKKA